MDCPNEELLVELVEGRMDASSLDRFHDHVSSCRSCRELMAALARRTDPGAAEPSPGQTIAQYCLERRIGRGGMGVVYAAFDTRLRRRVALKFMLPGLAGDERARSRLRREARAVSALDHPGVGQIYEVGDHQGALFLAMPLYEGETLKARLARGPLAPREAAQLLAQIAEALAAAHAAGIVHRDVKPANVMLAADGRARLLDFGLAKTMDPETLLTSTGHLLGTVAYMAPEQQSGGTVGAGVDVWAAGVTAYEMLSGSLPFSGASPIQVLQRAANQDPAPLRVDADLQTIVGKCLEKDPARRYPGGAALASDLRRWLAGEPISARPIGPAARLVRRVRRQWLALGAAALGAIVLVLGVTTVRNRHDGQVRVERAQRLGQATQRMRNLMRNAYLLPLHDTRPERTQVEAELRSIAEESQRSGDGSGGLAEYALGWGQLILGRHAEAQPHLLAAYQAGQHNPEVAWVIAFNLTRLYLAELRKADGEPASRRAALLEATQREFHDPILGYLKAAEGAPDLPPAAIQALVALAEKRFAEAAKEAKQVFEQAPSMYELGAAAADAYYQDAMAAWAAGKSDEAFASFARAADGYQRVAAVARSDDAIRISQATVLLEDAYYRSLADRPGIDEIYQRILPLCDEAARIAPDSSAADEMRAVVWYRQAERLTSRGEDSRPLLEKVAALAEAVERRDPRSWRARLSRGSALVSLGELAAQRGENPRAQFEPAWRALEASRALHRDSEQGNQMCVAYDRQARYEAGSGGDPRPEWVRSVALAHEMLEYEPENVLVRNNLGCTLVERATYELEHGDDPELSLREAEQALEQTLRNSPNEAEPLANLAAVYGIRARHVAATGGDPRDLLQHAVDLGERAVALNGEIATMQEELANAWSLMAWNDRRHGRDLARAVERARSRAEAALRGSSQLVGARLVLVQLELEAAEPLIARRRDPSPNLARARKHLAEALVINPRDAEPRLYQGELDRVEAEIHILRGQPCRDSCDAGREALTAALARDPHMARAWAARARIDRVCAGAEADPQRRAAAETQAQAAHERALALDRFVDGDR